MTTTDHIDLGPGWREVPYDQWRGEDVPMHENTAYLRIGVEDHFYFREEPVPPLPTEPFTVIRVAWRDPEATVGRVWTLMEDGRWGIATPDSLRDRIVSFEVLAVPPKTVGQATVEVENVRREAAKAVLSRVRQIGDSLRCDLACDAVAREMGLNQ